ncbi:peptidoglycan DD-metalloendopeptidase family protein [Candidatus Micrarchaeota archaeon]|nr:peptidoglycan DD-metalloendopeptidase family protein [Candidatus Micrarchaeota archaeon]
MLSHKLIVFGIFLSLLIVGCTKQSEIEKSSIDQKDQSETQSQQSKVQPESKEPEEFGNMAEECKKYPLPPDCNMIPYPEMRVYCEKCKELGAATESPELFTFPEPPTKSDDKFIIANPLDLSQIKSFSKFRSCVGHDYSGVNTEGEKEALRSMKHYITPLESAKKADIFAPFDGKVSEIEDSYPGKQIYLSSNAAGGWQFIFFHVNLNSEIKVGSEVKAGQKIGSAELTPGGSFDYGLKNFGFQQVFDSPFLHMNDFVIEEYETKGVTQENIIISKKTRDSEPCKLSGVVEQGDAFFAGYPEEDVVILKSK